ncbi:uncharacterized protein LOC130443108 [Diorhabda sublineata]|uniref:uncharacterized protein LOC130443108 n=1 Tax=Diorhabda sublineata TaxID=1163346 RepID=UPI0024E170D9|nr:uncharacterized protein LOC130443108 [Diorhabda sublineata]
MESDLKRKRKRRIWVRNWLQNKSSGATSMIMKELYYQDPREYQAVMRLTPSQFEILLNLIATGIQRSDTFMRKAIPARVKLEITLTFLASGMTFRMLSVLYRVSKASISKMIPKVCDAISDSLKDYIKIPNQDEWQDIQLGFNERWDFPGCCGAIDGKHIIIQAPPNSGSEYYNYKGTNSIVLLALVDHNYCFKYVDIGSYGRNADGGVFQNSSLYPLLENDSLLPQGAVLVGDDAFPLKPYLLKPYSSTPTIAEKIFNYRLSRARRIVENGFGILAARFRILGKPIQVDEQTAIKIIKSTCTLHNWLRMTMPNTYTPPGSADYEDNINLTIIQGRSRINKRSKAIAEKLRNKYRDYFSGEGAVDWQTYMIK